MLLARNPARPHKRKGFWCLVRRVPTRYQPFDKRGIVGIPITDDPRAHAAKRVVADLDATFLTRWRDLARTPDPQLD